MSFDRVNIIFASWFPNLIISMEFPSSSKLRNHNPLSSRIKLVVQIGNLNNCVFAFCSASEKARQSWKKYMAYENSKIVGREPQL